MKALNTGLAVLLTEQKGVLDTMLELSLEERETIIAGKSELLEEVVRKQLKQLSILKAIEKKRDAMLDDYSFAMSIPKNEITLTMIAMESEPDDREVIQRLQLELTAVLNRHTEIINENRELINAHMEYADKMLDVMVDNEDPLNNFYGGDGKSAPDRKKTTGFFDSQA